MGFVLFLSQYLFDAPNHSPNNTDMKVVTHNTLSTENGKRVQYQSVPSVYNLKST